MRSDAVPHYVLDLHAVTLRVDEKRQELKAMDRPTATLVEFEVAGNWFGTWWRRTRHFKWMVYVALWDSDGSWVDHAEDLVARGRGRRDWVLIQNPDRAIAAAERFARSHLERRPD